VRENKADRENRELASPLSLFAPVQFFAAHVSSILQNEQIRATLYPLTPEGRGKGLPIAINDRTITPSLLPQVPYILVPVTE